MGIDPARRRWALNADERETVATAPTSCTRCRAPITVGQRVRVNTWGDARHEQCPTPPIAPKHLGPRVVGTAPRNTRCAECNVAILAGTGRLVVDGARRLVVCEHPEYCAERKAARGQSA